MATEASPRRRRSSPDKSGRSSSTSLMENLLGLLRIRVKRGVNLAVRDVRSSDPYVVIKMNRQVSFFLPYLSFIGFFFFFALIFYSMLFFLRIRTYYVVILLSRSETWAYVIIWCTPCFLWNGLVRNKYSFVGFN